MRNPSPAPLNNITDRIELVDFFWTDKLSPAMIVRMPIYISRHAPDNCRVNKILDREVEAQLQYDLLKER